MEFTTGMSKEGKKIMNSRDEAIQKDIKNLLSPEDLAILERNSKKEGEKVMKQINKFIAKTTLTKVN